MKKLLIGLIYLYQITPFHTHSMCRFTPTCSEYIKQAIIEYGVFKGTQLGLSRIIKCRPGGGFGYDPLVIRRVNEKNI